MPTFTYTALRNLKAGHSASTEYTITSALMTADDDQPEPDKAETVSIGGNVKTIFRRIDQFLDVTTDYVNRDGTGTPDYEDWEEFFHSVAGGESFVYNNGSDRTAIMASKPARNREGIFWNYRFRIRFID